MNSNATRIPGRIPHRIAVVLAIVVFPLIWLGGLVTTTDAGMAVPDWPGTYGYNLFLYPIETWLFGPFDLLVEHGHRQLAALSGLIAIVLVAATFRWEARRWVRWFSVGLLLLVIAQGLLGGIRVLRDDRAIAQIHGCVGPAFFMAVTAFCVVTSRWWFRAESAGYRAGAGRCPTWMPWAAILLLMLSYGQLAVGAGIRHIPPDAPTGRFVLLVAVHLVTAAALVLGSLGYGLGVWRRAIRGAGVRLSANLACLLVGTQFLLGLGTWVVKYGWPAWMGNLWGMSAFVIGEKTFLQTNLVTAHVAVGSLILCVWTIHALRVRRWARLGCDRVVSTRRDPFRSTAGVESSDSAAEPIDSARGFVTT